MWRWDQAEPFGNNPAEEDPDANSVAFDLPLRLPGQRYDAETGLHYNMFRDYDPSLGIYKQSDLIGLRGGLNTYAYAASMPISHADPTGLFLGIPGLGEQGSLGGSAAIPVVGGIGVGIGIDMLAWRTCCGDDKKKYIEFYSGINVGISAGASARMSGSREGLVNIVTVGDATLPRCQGAVAVRGPSDASLSMTFSGTPGLGVTVGVEQGQSGGMKGNVGLSPAAGISGTLNLVGADLPLKKVGPIGCCP